MYEKKINEFAKIGFFDGRIAEDVKYLKNIEMATIELINSTERFEFYFDNL